jgi:hypothetical protein
VSIVDHDSIQLRHGCSNDIWLHFVAIKHPEGASDQATSGVSDHPIQKGKTPA